jgi:hypothetical protein
VRRGPAFLSRPRVLQPKRRQRHGAPFRNKRARHASAPSTGIWQAWSRIVQRGPAFKPPKSSSDQALATVWRPSPQ